MFHVGLLLQQKLSQCKCTVRGRDRTNKDKTPVAQSDSPFSRVKKLKRVLHESCGQPVCVSNKPGVLLKNSKNGREPVSQSTASNPLSFNHWRHRGLHDRMVPSVSARYSQFWCTKASPTQARSTLRFHDFQGIVLDKFVSSTQSLAAAMVSHFCARRLSQT